jgi:hypothetical protein
MVYANNHPKNWDGYNRLSSKIGILIDQKWGINYDKLILNDRSQLAIKPLGIS